MKSLRTLAIGLAGLVLSSAAMADLYIEYSTKSETQVTGQEAQKQEYTAKHWFKADKVAQEDQTGRSITRFDKQLLWRTETAAKTYTETSFDDLKKQMEEARKQIEEGRKKIEEQLKSTDLSEDAKEALKKSLAAMGPIKYTVEKGDAEKVADHDCVRWTVKANDQKVYEVWAAESLDAGVDLGKLHDLTAAAQPGLAEELKKIKGVWLKWEMESKSATHTMKQTSVATKVSKDAIEDSAFDLPAGFNKKGAAEHPKGEEKKPEEKKEEKKEEEKKGDD